MGWEDKMDWEKVKKAEQDALNAEVKWEISVESIVNTTDDDIADLLTRWKILENENRDRLFRKIVEELGELAEAIEFENGSTNKVKKFKGKNPGDMLEEEICDVVMMALALAKYEGLGIRTVLENVSKKLEKKRTG